MKAELQKNQYEMRTSSQQALDATAEVRPHVRCTVWAMPGFRAQCFNLNLCVTTAHRQRECIGANMPLICLLDS
jgi:hypothetical protein